jgi:FtsH-binding integral membrane protein
MPSYDQFPGGGVGLAGTRSQSYFGEVMGLVGITVVFAALGAYLGRNLNSGFVLIIPVFVCLFGLQWAAGGSTRGRGRGRGMGVSVGQRQTHPQAAIALLFAMGLFMGIFGGGIIHYYALTRPTAVYQAAGTTALATLGLGAIGYTTSHDLSGWLRPLMYSLFALIIFGLVASFVAIPHSNIIYCVAGIGIFSLLTVFDFQRLSKRIDTPVLIAAAIFLDIFNMFILLLSLFGGGGGRR